jgi:hypothetical protein
MVMEDHHIVKDQSCVSANPQQFITTIDSYSSNKFIIYNLVLPIMADPLRRLYKTLCSKLINTSRKDLFYSL